MGMPHTLVPWRGQAPPVGALAWASRGQVLALAWARWCLGVGKLHALVPWHGQGQRVGALAWARWSLGVASRGHVLPLALALDVLILASAC